MTEYIKKYIETSEDRWLTLAIAHKESLDTLVNGNTALTNAIMTGDSDKAVMLLKIGADPAVKNWQGRNAFAVACFCNNEIMLDYLTKDIDCFVIKRHQDKKLQHGFFMSQKNNDGVLITHGLFTGNWHDAVRQDCFFDQESSFILQLIDKHYNPLITKDLPMPPPEKIRGKSILSQITLWGDLSIR